MQKDAYIKQLGDQLNTQMKSEMATLMASGTALTGIKQHDSQHLDTNPSDIQVNMSQNHALSVIKDNKSAERKAGMQQMAQPKES